MEWKFGQGRHTLIMLFGVTLLKQYEIAQTIKKNSFTKNKVPQETPT